MNIFIWIYRRPQLISAWQNRNEVFCVRTLNCILYNTIYCLYYDGRHKQPANSSLPGSCLYVVKLYVYIFHVFVRYHLTNNGYKRRYKLVVMFTLLPPSLCKMLSKNGIAQKDQKTHYSRHSSPALKRSIWNMNDSIKKTKGWISSCHSLLP